MSAGWWPFFGGVAAMAVLLAGLWTLDRLSREIPDLPFDDDAPDGA